MDSFFVIHNGATVELVRGDDYDRVVGELKDTILKQDRAIVPLQAQVAERDKLVRQQGEAIERLEVERDHWKSTARDMADARDGWMGQCGKLEREREAIRKQLQQAEQQRQTPSDNALFVEVMGRVRDRGFELADALHQILAKGLGL